MILITGGLGFIGSHITIELLNNNYEVLIIDNFANSNKNIISKIEKITGKSFIFYKVDIRDYEKLEELFNNYKDKHIFTHIYMPTDLVSVKNVKFETNYYKLAQNYPNPFNPETIINYELGVSEFVTIKIYNVLGQEVAELVKKEQKAGNYSLIFNGADLPSGVYLVHMRAGNYTNTIKAVLNK